LLKKVIGKDFILQSVEKKPGKRSPAAPFTTSTLQQAASTRLGFSVRQTMVLAQKLYEAGHITYMRTDSVSLSDQALKQARQEKDLKKLKTKPGIVSLRNITQIF
jgi:DNA topoisomerase-1